MLAVDGHCLQEGHTAHCHQKPARAGSQVRVAYHKEDLDKQSKAQGESGKRRCMGKPGILKTCGHMFAVPYHYHTAYCGDA
jgi:hypothetical protein